MGIMRKSRLSRHKQDRLVEHFVAGTTARCAASLVGVNFKTSAYYFHRLREIIAYNLEQEADTVFSGEVEVDESYFGGKRKGKRGRGAAGKVPVFGLLKRGGRSTRRSYLMLRQRLYTPSLSVRLCLTGLSILTAGGVTTYWMSRPSSTSVSTTQNCLQTKLIISTELKTSGIKPSVICANLMVFQRSILGYF